MTKRRRLFGSLDHQPSVRMCLVAIKLLEKAKKMSRFITIVVRRKGKRRTVACMKATSCS